MPKKRFDVPGVRSFDSVGEAKATFKTILNSRPIGTALGLDSEEGRLVAGLVELHRYAEEVIGSGIADIEIIQPPEHSTRCFAVRRTDGSLGRFSYSDCITRFSADADLTAALRAEIADQIAVARRNEIVHHDEVPFRDIRNAWLSAEGVTADAIEISKGDARQYRLVDRDLATRWHTFHADRATLKSVSRDDHRRLHAKEAE
jgi:hypothetical protein